MQVVLRPDAEQEILEAQSWYESKALGLPSNPQYFLSFRIQGAIYE